MKRKGKEKNLAVSLLVREGAMNVSLVK